MADEELENQDGDEEETEEETEDEESEEESTEESEKPDKRINDLTSARDKETARANAAEKALAAIRGKGKEGSNDPQVTALMQELRDASLDAVFSAQPKLSEYGIDRALIEGSTRSELRASADQLVALIEQVETKATNRALAKHGIDAAPVGSRREKPLDIANMPKDEFEKLIARAKQGGNPVG